MLEKHILRAYFKYWITIAYFFCCFQNSITSYMAAAASAEYKLLSRAIGRVFAPGKNLSSDVSNKTKYE